MRFLFLGRDLVQPDLGLLQVRGQRVQRHAQLGGSLVHQVNRLVRQLAVGHVARREPRRRLQSGVRVVDAVMVFVAGAQPVQHLNCLFHRRLVDKDRRKAALQRAVAFDVLAVFVQRGRAHALQLAARQGRLEHVAGVHSALCGAGADDGVQLVDKEDDLALGALDLLHDSLQTLFKLAAEAAAGNHRAQVERDDAAIEQIFGYVIGDDLLRQPFDNRRLAHAGLANENRVVLGAAAEYLDEAHDLPITADHRIELAFTGQLRQIAAVLIQRAVAALGLAVGDTLAATQVENSVHDPLAGDAKLLQNARRRCIALAENRQKDMFGGNKLVLQPAGFTLGQLEDGTNARRVKDLANAAAVDRNLGAAPQLLVQARFQLWLVHAEVVQNLGYDAVSLFEQGQEHMLGIHLSMAVALHDVIGACGGILSPLRKSIKSHLYPSF